VNIKEYISSGIVESYVLGLVTDAEKQEFEAMSLQYPELAEARIQFEELVEKKMMSEGVNPPVALKEKIENSIQPSANPAYADMYEEEQAPVRKMFDWKWVAAAAVILFAGSLVWALMLNSDKKQLASENEELKSQLSTAQTEISEYRQLESTLHKPGMRLTAMNATPASPGSLAAVYWDTTSHDVYLLVNNLPEAPTDKQYQLWAIIDKQPVDLGVFEIRQEKLLVKMKNVTRAQAFAITLEPKGGSPAPTMEAMHVYGGSGLPAKPKQH
jgi:anti-sigma-K factor RskA